MSVTIGKSRSRGPTSLIATSLTIAQAFDAGWAGHRDGIHWKRCGLDGDNLHAWQGGWAAREAAGRKGLLP